MWNPADDSTKEASSLVQDKGEYPCDNEYLPRGSWPSDILNRTLLPTQDSRAGTSCTLRVGYEEPQWLFSAGTEQVHVVWKEGSTASTSSTLKDPGLDECHSGSGDFPQQRTGMGMGGDG